MNLYGANWSRRDFLSGSGSGIGALALATMLLDSSRPALGTHFKPRAKSVIHLFMHGGPSHMDLFDPKPALTRHAGQPLPESFGPVLTRRNVGHNTLLRPVRPFRRRGESGLEISDFYPHLAECADDLCLLRGCHGDSVNHPQSVYQMNTGSVLMGRPSLGSWLAYGLGTENNNMPAYAVLPDPEGAPKGGPPAWGSAFLPAKYQGTLMRAGAEPILNLKPHESISRREQRAALDLIRQINQHHLERRDFDSDLEARVSAYELAFRMQTEAPVVVDIAGETQATRRLYGIGEKDTDDFGRRCLLARRMVERGVRFVQLYSGGRVGWDAHSNVEKNHSLLCRRTDRPIAGLLRDLRDRGLFDDTLVIWGGEFGRMPMNEQGVGRDHNPWGYTVWLSGGGVKGGISHGATDEIGLRAVDGKVHIRDLHATILHLLGIRQEELSFSQNGREERFTEIVGKVVQEILA